jgi:hypothetical protein
MNRNLSWGVLVIGLVLIIAPFAIGLPGKASDGQKMIDAFEPIMEEDNVAQTVDYYDNVFVPLGDIVPAMSQENIDLFNGYLAGIGGMGTEAQALVPAFAEATGMTEEQAAEMMATNFPAMMQMMQGLPQMQEDFEGLLGLMGANVGIFERVPPGLDHYLPLVETMEAQRTNYDSIAGLPDFRLFTWFFVIPGVLLLGLGAAGLLAGRREAAA